MIVITSLSLSLSPHCFWKNGTYAISSDRVEWRGWKTDSERVEWRAARAYVLLTRREVTQKITSKIRRCCTTWIKLTKYNIIIKRVDRSVQSDDEGEKLSHESIIKAHHRCREFVDHSAFNSFRSYFPFLGWCDGWNKIFKFFFPFHIYFGVSSC